MITTRGTTSHTVKLWERGEKADGGRVGEMDTAESLRLPLREITERIPFTEC